MKSEAIPSSHIDLIAGPVYVVFTTVAPDGQPENTVVWCSWDGSHVVVNSTDDRRKTKNAGHNPLVALTAVDPSNPLRWVDVRGFVETIVTDEGNANIDAHTRLYTEFDVFFGGYAAIGRRDTEQRVIMKIKPTRVLTYPH